MGGGHRELRFSVHHPDWIETTACGEAGRWMMENDQQEEATVNSLPHEHNRGLLV
jgi:hypothetical protein